MSKTKLDMIDELAAKYAAALRKTEDRAAVVKEEMRAVYRRELPGLKRAVKEAQEIRDELELTIKAAPMLFQEPKTKTLHDIRLGFKKQRGKVIIPDEEATIKLIRKELPEDQQELLIRKREEVHKPSVYDLEVKDAKRLGIRIEDDNDEVYINQAASNIEKLIKGWADDEAA